MFLRENKLCDWVRERNAVLRLDAPLSLTTSNAIQASCPEASHWRGKPFILCIYKNERTKFKELVDDYVITWDKSYDKAKKWHRKSGLSPPNSSQKLRTYVNDGNNNNNNDDNNNNNNSGSCYAFCVRLSAFTKTSKMLHEIMFIYLKLLLIIVTNDDRETCSDSLNAFNLKLPNWPKTFRQPQ